MAQVSSDRSAHSAPAQPPWRRLLPWTLLVLALHAWWLAPEPPAPLRAPSALLQWRLTPASASSAAGATAPAPAGRQADGAITPAKTARTPPAAPARQPEPPALIWPPSGSWHYRLRWQGEDGVALLEWRLVGERYSLSLYRRLDSRGLPTWHSEGLVNSDGLRPQRFGVERSSGRRQRVDTAVEMGAQDRLSWIFQAAAIARAQQAQVGQTLSLPVSGWRGGVQAWSLRVEADSEQPGLLRLRRLPLSAGSPLEQLLWLDPSRGYLPVRLRQRYDDAERWELQWESAPPVAAGTPSAD